MIDDLLDGLLSDIHVSNLLDDVFASRSKDKNQDAGDYDLSPESIEKRRWDSLCE